MKRLLFILCVGLVLAACGNPAKNKPVDLEQSDRVEVLVFYGKQRCPTCRAIEQLTREVVERDFAEQIKTGAVVLRIVDIAADEAVADKYEVTWSSLYVVVYKQGQERAENLTEFAFANARNNPDKFKDSVKRKIGELLE